MNRTFARIVGGAAVTGVGLLAAFTSSASADDPRASADDPRWATGVVDAEGGLIAHIAPSVHAQDTYGFPDGEQMTLNCMTKGTSVEGDSEWYLVAAEGEAKWVSARYVNIVGEEPEYCGSDMTQSVTLADDAQSYQGPTTSDEPRRAFPAGSGQEAVCHVTTAPGANEKWVATLEDGWIPASALTSIDGVPYCQQ